MNYETLATDDVVKGPPWPSRKRVVSGWLGQKFVEEGVPADVLVRMGRLGVVGQLTALMPGGVVKESWTNVAVKVSASCNQRACAVSNGVVVLQASDGATGLLSVWDSKTGSFPSAISTAHLASGRVIGLALIDNLLHVASASGSQDRLVVRVSLCPVLNATPVVSKMSTETFSVQPGGVPHAIFAASAHGYRCLVVQVEALLAASFSEDGRYVLTLSKTKGLAAKRFVPLGGRARSDLPVAVLDSTVYTGNDGVVLEDFCTKWQAKAGTATSFTAGGAYTDARWVARSKDAGWYIAACSMESVTLLDPHQGGVIVYQTTVQGYPLLPLHPLSEPTLPFGLVEEAVGRLDIEMWCISASERDLSKAVVAQRRWETSDRTVADVEALFGQLQQEYILAECRSAARGGSPFVDLKRKMLSFVDSHRDASMLRMCLTGAVLATQPDRAAGLSTERMVDVTAGPEIEEDKKLRTWWKKLAVSTARGAVADLARDCASQKGVSELDVLLKLSCVHHDPLASDESLLVDILDALPPSVGASSVERILPARGGGGGVHSIFVDATGCAMAKPLHLSPGLSGEIAYRHACQASGYGLHAVAGSWVEASGDERLREAHQAVSDLCKASLKTTAGKAFDAVSGTLKKSIQTYRSGGASSPDPTPPPPDLPRVFFEGRPPSIARYLALPTPLKLGVSAACVPGRGLEALFAPLTAGHDSPPGAAPPAEARVTRRLAEMRAEGAAFDAKAVGHLRTLIFSLAAAKESFAAGAPGGGYLRDDQVTRLLRAGLHDQGTSLDVLQALPGFTGRTDAELQVFFLEALLLENPKTAQHLVTSLLQEASGEQANVVRALARSSRDSLDAAASLDDQPKLAACRDILDLWKSLCADGCIAKNAQDPHSEQLRAVTQRLDTLLELKSVFPAASSALKPAGDAASLVRAVLSSVPSVSHGDMSRFASMARRLGFSRLDLLSAAIHFSLGDRDQEMAVVGCRCVIEASDIPAADSYPLVSKVLSVFGRDLPYADWSLFTAHLLATTPSEQQLFTLLDQRSAQSVKHLSEPHSPPDPQGRQPARKAPTFDVALHSVQDILASTRSIVFASGTSARDVVASKTAVDALVRQEAARRKAITAAENTHRWLAKAQVSEAAMRGQIELLHAFEAATTCFEGAGRARLLHQEATSRLHVLLASAHAADGKREAAARSALQADRHAFVHGECAVRHAELRGRALLATAEALQRLEAGIRRTIEASAARFSTLRTVEAAHVHGARHLEVQDLEFWTRLALIHGELRMRKTLPASVREQSGRQSIELEWCGSMLSVAETGEARLRSVVKAEVKLSYRLITTQMTESSERRAAAASEKSQRRQLLAEFERLSLGARLARLQTDAVRTKSAAFDRVSLEHADATRRSRLYRAEHNAWHDLFGSHLTGLLAEDEEEARYLVEAAEDKEYARAVHRAEGERDEANIRAERLGKVATAEDGLRDAVLGGETAARSELLAAAALSLGAARQQELTRRKSLVDAEKALQQVPPCEAFERKALDKEEAAALAVLDDRFRNEKFLAMTASAVSRGNENGVRDAETRLLDAVAELVANNRAEDVFSKSQMAWKATLGKDRSYPPASFVKLTLCVASAVRAACTEEVPSPSTSRALYAASTWICEKIFHGLSTFDLAMQSQLLSRFLKMSAKALRDMEEAERRQGRSSQHIQKSVRAIESASVAFGLFFEPDSVS
ncbi:hypothetical protein DIPPA_12016 [Diplonema papillatum]|nr:hypothetical protein DIPPA_12016 [Diplonema papillatum]